MKFQENNKDNLYYKFKEGQFENNSEIDLNKILSNKINREIFFTIEENFEFIEHIIDEGMGLVKNNFEIFDGKIKIGIAFIKSMTDEELLSKRVLQPLLNESKVGYLSSKDAIELIRMQCISAVDSYTTSYMGKVIEELLKGNIALFLNNSTEVIIIGNSKIPKRAIEKPENEVAIYASKESFTEDLDTNCSMIIKRLLTPDVHFETFTIGKYSKTLVKLVWIEGIANPKIISEVYERINKINIDNISCINDIAELIQDHPKSIFPIFKQTERPDFVSKYLTDGHFIIMCSNSPSVIIAPISLWDNFKTMDDYSESPIVSSYIRIIRIASFIISITISSIYLSAITYTHSIVPPVLALNFLSGRQGIPAPSIVELLLMTFMVGIIREAGIRMPGIVGYFIGSFGAVILGQSAVAAGYVSASLIIVVATASIASFAISSNKMVNASRLINYFFIVLSGFFGMFGLINGIVLLLWYLVLIKSFGVPYLYPVVPFEREGNKDIAIRSSLKNLKKRLRWLSIVNRNRNNTNR